MFEKIFVENEYVNHPRVLVMQQKFSQALVVPIDKIENSFGRFKKPYLQKRSHLNLYIGRKKGLLVKPAPPAYGVIGDPHYYFVHAYNCIYECQYCYLQGYFNSPDIVLFLNHDEIGNEILATIQKHPEQKTWFHAGEFSDSLALSHLTGEVDFYWSLLADHPKAYLELRTKSVNIKPVLKQKPAANIFVTFSLSPARRALQSDLKTPTTAARLQAMKALVDAGFCVGVHLDPMIYDIDFVQNYQRLIEEWVRLIPPEKISYISVGVVRFSKDVYRQVKNNYPDSDLLQQEFTSGFDQKIRYSYPLRSAMLETVKNQLLSAGFADQQIYFCMEEND